MTTSTTTDPRELSLYAWQRDALRDWRANRCRGIVEAVTGTGKTRLAIAAIGGNRDAGGQSVVLVPTRQLQDQWVHAIAEGLPGVRVGRWGNGHHDRMDDFHVVVAVVNSALKHLPQIRYVDLLVADECHRYGARAFRTALVRVPHRLGLTATLERSDEGVQEALLPYFGEVVHRIGYERALADRIVSPFTVDLIGLDFAQPSSRRRYDALTMQMDAAKGTLVSRCGYPRDPGAFLERATSGRARWQLQEGRLCSQFMRAYTERRNLLASDPAKAQALAGLAPDILASGRCLVFTETVAAALACERALSAAGARAAALHSGLKPKDRARPIEDFAHGRLDALVAPKMLDEGVDVPGADLGIIVSASRSKRQMIQRMGRILRRKPDGRSSRFVILHLRGTGEDPATGAHEAFLDEVLTHACDITGVLGRRSLDLRTRRP